MSTFARIEGPCQSVRAGKSQPRCTRTCVRIDRLKRKTCHRGGLIISGIRGLPPVVLSLAAEVAAGWAPFAKQFSLSGKAASWTPYRSEKTAARRTYFVSSPDLGMAVFTEKACSCTHRLPYSSPTFEPGFYFLRTARIVRSSYCSSSCR